MTLSASSQPALDHRAETNLALLGGSKLGPQRLPRVAIISPLPAALDGEPQSGVGQYLVEILQRLSDKFDVTVLAGSETHYQNIGTANVLPTWSSDGRCVRQIRQALKHLDPDLIHLQHEFNLFGGMKPTAALTAALSAGGLLGGRPRIMTIHGVIDKKTITPTLLRQNYLPNSPFAARAALSTIYRTMAAASSQLVVHHEHFNKVLTNSYHVKDSKISTIPFGADQVSKHKARAGGKLSGPRILLLGFLTSYKKPELVVEMAEENLIPGATFQFCIGHNPRIKSLQYEERYSQLRSRVMELGSRATWSGYVPDDELPDLFAGSDVLVLPYTECISGSAVAALAQAHGVSVSYSRALEPLLGSADGCFDLNTGSLASAVLAAYSSQSICSSSFATWSEVAAHNEAVWATALNWPRGVTPTVVRPVECA